MIPEPNRVRRSIFYRLVPVFAVSFLVLLSVMFFWGPAARAIHVEAVSSRRSRSISARKTAHRGDRPGDRPGPLGDPRPGLLLHLRPDRQALLKAHRRGIKVEVILDKSQKTQKYSSSTFLTNAGIPTYIDAEHAIAHNKIILIDRSVVITGSFNFTRAAEEKNAENLLIIRSKELTRLYLDNWLRHRNHSSV